MKTRVLIKNLFVAFTITSFVLLAGCKAQSPTATISPAAVPSPPVASAEITPTASPKVSEIVSPSPKTQVAQSVLTDTYYKNESMGITLEFPSEWMNRCIIEESKNRIAVYSKEIREESE